MPDSYVCIGVKEPFVIRGIETECTEYNDRRTGSLFGKNLNTIVINGKKYTGYGNNIVIQNNRVIVDGEVLEPRLGNNAEVTLYGDVRALEVSGSVTVHGNAGNIDCGGSCTVDGSVSGSIRAGGSAKCGDVLGNVNAGGSVSINR